jgi:glycosyltransferase involved in cell wall biosynthesis
MSAGRVWVVTAAAPVGPSGVIGGGGQSARNLLLGLRDLDAPFTPVAQVPAAGPAAGPAATEFGPGLCVGLPPPAAWADPAAVGLLGRLLAEHRPALVHLLDPVPHLGSWLRALRGHPAKVVFTGLDYNWLCANAQLLTRRLVQCPGPRSAAECLRCHFDHREPLKALALRGLAAAATLPTALTRWLPRRLAGPVGAARAEVRATAERLVALPDDFRRLDALIAPSRALAERYAANGLDAKKIVHIPYGTCPGTPVPLEDRPPLAAGVAFGFVGRVEVDKGPDLLADALLEVRRTTPHRPRLVVFGGRSATGFNRAYWRRLALPACRDWAEAGTFDGRDPAAIDAAHRRIHFQVAPSRWTDNLPNAGLEGLARRTPVLAPAQGSLPEMVADGDTGWLYDPADPRALADLVRRVAADPERHFRLPFAAARARPPAAEAAAVCALYQSLAPE